METNLIIPFASFAATGSTASSFCWLFGTGGGFSGTVGWEPSMASQCPFNDKSTGNFGRVSFSSSLEDEAWSINTQLKDEFTMPRKLREKSRSSAQPTNLRSISFSSWKCNSLPPPLANRNGIRSGFWNPYSGSTFRDFKEWSKSAVDNRLRRPCVINLTASWRT